LHNRPLHKTLRCFGFGFVLAGLAATVAPAWANCELGSVAALPVTMRGVRPLVSAKINGQDVEFSLSSGSDYSMITKATAEKLNLPRDMLPLGFFVSGSTGAAEAELGRVSVLTLAGAPLRDMQVIVADSEPGQGSVGALGQDILGVFDVEYDLARGMVHLWRPKGCSGSANLAYWSNTMPVSAIDLDVDYFNRRFERTRIGRTKGPIYVNGVRLTASFNTGAGSSIMTREAAARVGLTPNDPGVVKAGYWRSLGKREVQSWIGTIKSFKIGDEEIKNTKIRFADIELNDADMVVGVDFFLAHRIFVSNQQHKLYLSYNGGPVFDLSQTPKLIVQGAPPSATAGAGSASDPLEPEPTDAEGFARRGGAYAARNNLTAALADLDKAIELAPTVAEYHYSRGLYYRRDRAPVLALSDFDEALKLKPNDPFVLVARAALYMANNDTALAVQDLEAADKASAKQDDVHLQIANLYAIANMSAAAIHQYSVWIDAHDDDGRLAQALNGRCWQRALSGVDLDKALNDCNRAIRNAPKNASMLDTRGLVHLRLGELDKAIADYDSALALNPKLGWSLYGRGLAKQRKGLTAEGAADIAAAVALNPKLPDEVTKRGLT